MTSLIHDRELTFAMLKTIGQYYPIGLPLLTKQYEGYKKLVVIMEAKMDELARSGRIDPWNRMIDEIRISFPENVIQDFAARQFPSLAVSIQLNLVVEDIVSRSKSIELFISLLGPFYTLYLKDQFLESPLDVKAIPRSTSWASEPAQSQFSSLKEVISRFYPQFNFVSHRQLYRTMVIGALPHGEDLESTSYENPDFKFPLFDFLFGANSQAPQV